MEKRMRTSLLLSFYGPLLTERQRELLRLHEEDDLSFPKSRRKRASAARQRTTPSGAARSNC